MRFCRDLILGLISFIIIAFGLGFLIAVALSIRFLGIIIGTVIISFGVYLLFFR